MNAGMQKIVRTSRFGFHKNSILATSFANLGCKFPEGTVWGTFDTYVDPYAYRLPKKMVFKSRITENKSGYQSDARVPKAREVTFNAQKFQVAMNMPAR